MAFHCLSSRHAFSLLKKKVFSPWQCDKDHSQSLDSFNWIVLAVQLTANVTVVISIQWLVFTDHNALAGWMVSLAGSVIGARSVLRDQYDRISVIRWSKGNSRYAKWIVFQSLEVFFAAYRVVTAKIRANSSRPLAIGYRGWIGTVCSLCSVCVWLRRRLTNTVQCYSCECSSDAIHRSGHSHTRWQVVYLQVDLMR